MQSAKFSAQYFNVLNHKCRKQCRENRKEFTVKRWPICSNFFLCSANQVLISSECLVASHFPRERFTKRNEKRAWPQRILLYTDGTQYVLNLLTQYLLRSSIFQIKFYKVYFFQERLFFTPSKMLVCCEVSWQGMRLINYFRLSTYSVSQCDFHLRF